MSSAVLSFKPKQRRLIGRVFVTFYNGPKDMDVVTEHLETEEGLNSRDTVMAVHRFRGGDCLQASQGEDRSMGLVSLRGPDGDPHIFVRVWQLIRQTAAQIPKADAPGSIRVLLAPATQRTVCDWRYRAGVFFVPLDCPERTAARWAEIDNAFAARRAARGQA
jgi:hypothetical protein